MSRGPQKIINAKNKPGNINKRKQQIQLGVILRVRLGERLHLINYIYVQPALMIVVIILTVITTIIIIAII